MHDLKTYSYQDHKISPLQISKSTRWVVGTLQKRGFQAYVVGGCLRDLLFNKQPKDFDVATNARPIQVKKIFPNAIIIGRRFQLAHILTGKHVIEVSTFRSKPAKPSRLGRLLNFWQGKQQIDENTFGTIEEDVGRRDITINALYYDPRDKKIYDFVGGYEDIKNKRINIIGSPERRFDEDPMRIIRIIRFMAKLNLAVTPELRETMIKSFHLLHHLPPARLSDEMEKLFLTGHGQASFDKLQEFGLLGFFLAHTNKFLNRAPTKEKSKCHQLIKHTLAETDDRYHHDRPVAFTFVFAILLWFPYLQRRQKYAGNDSTRQTEHEEHRKAVQSLIYQPHDHSMEMPKYLFYRAARIWRLQDILLDYDKINTRKVMENRNFRTAYDLLKAYSVVEPKVRSAAEWWETYQRTHPFSAPAYRKKRVRQRRPS